MSEQTSTPILCAAVPPAGTTCAGCGQPIPGWQDAVTRDGVHYYHNAANGGCEAKTHSPDQGGRL